MKADEREIRLKPLLVNVGQGWTDARSESGQRSCPKSKDRPKPIRISRTTDTRIFSIRLYLSTEFSIDPNVLIQLTFPSVACLRMF